MSWSQSQKISSARREFRNSKGLRQCDMQYAYRWKCSAFSYTLIKAEILRGVDLFVEFWNVAILSVRHATRAILFGILYLQNIIWCVGWNVNMEEWEAYVLDVLVWFVAMSFSTWNTTVACDIVFKRTASLARACSQIYFATRLFFLQHM